MLADRVNRLSYRTQYLTPYGEIVTALINPSDDRPSWVPPDVAYVNMEDLITWELYGQDFDYYVQADGTLRRWSYRHDAVPYTPEEVSALPLAPFTIDDLHLVRMPAQP